jgi:hypothetical protein
MPLNFLFCGIPGIYYLFSIQFETGTTHVINIPASTSVEQFAQGFSSLNEAFLYGGAVFVATLVDVTGLIIYFSVAYFFLQGILL